MDLDDDDDVDNPRRTTTQEGIIGSPISEASGSSSGFLSWGKSRQSNEYTQTLGGRPSEVPNIANTTGLSSSILYSRRNSTDNQSELTSHTAQTRTSASTNASPTPFRPMPPKEFSLGGNVKRMMSSSQNSKHTMMMSGNSASSGMMPNLPPNVGSSFTGQSPPHLGGSFTSSAAGSASGGGSGWPTAMHAATSLGLGLKQQQQQQQQQDEETDAMNTTSDTVKTEYIQQRHGDTSYEANLNDDSATSGGGSSSQSFQGISRPGMQSKQSSMYSALSSNMGQSIDIDQFSDSDLLMNSEAADDDQNKRKIDQLDENEMNEGYLRKISHSPAMDLVSNNSDTSASQDYDRKQSYSPSELARSKQSYYSASSDLVSNSERSSTSISPAGGFNRPTRTLQTIEDMAATSKDLLVYEEAEEDDLLFLDNIDNLTGAGSYSRNQSLDSGIEELGKLDNNNNPSPFQSSLPTITQEGDTPNTKTSSSSSEKNKSSVSFSPDKSSSSDSEGLIQVHSEVFSYETPAKIGSGSQSDKTKDDSPPSDSTKKSGNISRRGSLCNDGTGADGKGGGGGEAARVYAELIGSSLANVKSPDFAVSPITPQEERVISPSVAEAGIVAGGDPPLGGGGGAAAPAPLVNSMRFGKLLQECRNLTETCGDDESSSSSYQSSSYPGSSTDKSSSRFGTSSSGNNVKGDTSSGGLSSKLERQQQRASAAAGRGEVGLISPIPEQTSIDTSANELKVSSLTMDPAINSSLLSTGGGRPSFDAGSGLRPSFGVGSQPGGEQNLLPHDEEEDESEEREVDTFRPQVRRQEKPGGLDNRSAGGMSDLSLGVDGMYGEDGEGALGIEEDDNTAPFDPSQFLMSQPGMMSQNRRGSNIISDLGMGHDAEEDLQEQVAVTPTPQQSSLNESRLPPSTTPRNFSTISALEHIDDDLDEPAPSTFDRLQPRQKNELQYSWLSYTTNGENDDDGSDKQKEEGKVPEKKVESTSATPLKIKSSDSDSSPIDELKIPDKGTYDDSTEFTGADEDGLLVGFGRRPERNASPTSEASSISSSSSDTSSSSSSGSSGSSPNPSGFGSSSSDSSSSGSGSSSSSSEGTSSSSEDSSMPASRLHIPSSNDSVGDVSALSFGGASALMAMQSMKTSPYLQSGQIRPTGSLGSGRGGGSKGGGSLGSGNSGSKASPDGISTDSGSPMKQAFPQTMGMNFQPGGRVRGKSVDRRTASLAAANPMLDALDEVSESNGSFLDDIESIAEPNKAVEKFLSSMPDVTGDDAADSVWSSFASSKAPSVAQAAAAAVAAREGVLDLSNKSGLDVSRKSVRSSASKSSDSSGPITGRLPVSSSAHKNLRDSAISALSDFSIHEDEPIKDEGLTRSALYTHPEQMEQRLSSSLKSHSSSSASSASRARESHASGVSRDAQSNASHNSGGSYYDGVVGRARALDTASPNNDQAQDASHSAQDAGIKSIESVRRISPTTGQGRANSAASNHSSIINENDDDQQHQGVHMQQSSGESPAEENLHPNDIMHPNNNLDSSNASSSNNVSEDGMSSMSSVVSKARSSFRDSISRARSSFSTRASQPGGNDAGRTSIISGLSGHSEKMATKTVEPVVSSDIVAGEAIEQKTASSHSRIIVDTKDMEVHQEPQPSMHINLQKTQPPIAQYNKDIEAVQAPPQDEIDKYSMLSGEDGNVNEGELYEDFPTRHSVSDVGGDDDKIPPPRPSQVISSNVVVEEETNWRKPWETSAPRKASLDDNASNVSSHFSATKSQLSTTNKPEPAKTLHVEESQQPTRDDNSVASSDNSELFESKAALKRMGLYSSVVPDQMNMSISSRGSSSMGEDFLSKAKIMTVVDEGSDSQEKHDGTSDMKADSRPLILGTTAADEMTEMLRKSALARSQQQQVEYNESNEDGQSEESEGSDVIGSLKAFHKKFYTRGSNDTAESNDDEDGRAEESKQGAQELSLERDRSSTTLSSRATQRETGSTRQTGITAATDDAVVGPGASWDNEEGTVGTNTRKSSSPPRKTSSTWQTESTGATDVAVGGNSSSEEEDGTDINNLIRSFKPKKKDAAALQHELSDSGSNKAPGSHQSDDSSVDAYSPDVFKKSRRLSLESLQYDDSDRTGKQSTRSLVSISAVMKGNPFFDDSSEEAKSDEEIHHIRDEETGLPPTMKPFSIITNDDTPKDEENPTQVEEKIRTNHDPNRKWGRSKKFWIILPIVIIAIIMIAVSAAQASKNKNPSPAKPSNDRNPSPPSSTSKTTPPTRLPTPLPTVTVIPNWVQVGGDLVGESPGDEAGFSVSVSADGSRAIVGARRNANDGMKNRGSARIFQFDSVRGFYDPIWNIYGEDAGDQAGFSVSMSANGERVAVGSLGSDKSGQNAGATRIFDQDSSSGEWILAAELLGDDDTALFGSSVSLSSDGKSLIVGAPYHSEGDTTRSGRAYVYRETQPTVWEQVNGPLYGTTSDDLFGWSVSISPDSKFVAVGAPRLEGSSDSGYVKVFSIVDDTWEIYGGTITKGTPGDRFGFSVSLTGSETLQRIAIGAPGMNANGEGSGMASVFDNEGNGWLQHGDDCLGYAEGDNLGYAVSMTPDGVRLLVGVPNKKLDEVPVGQVKVFDVNSGKVISKGEMYGRDKEKFGVSVSVSYEGDLAFGGASMANLVRAYGDL